MPPIIFDDRCSPPPSRSPNKPPRLATLRPPPLHTHDEPTTVRVLITGIAWPHAKLIHRHIGSEPIFSGKEWRLGSVNPQQIPSAIAEALANRQHVNLDLQAHFAPKW